MKPAKITVARSTPFLLRHMAKMFPLGRGYSWWNEYTVLSTKSMKHNFANLFQFLLYFKALKCLVNGFKIPLHNLEGKYGLWSQNMLFSFFCIAHSHLSMAKWTKGKSGYKKKELQRLLTEVGHGGTYISLNRTEDTADASKCWMCFLKRRVCLFTLLCLLLKNTLFSVILIYTAQKGFNILRVGFH